MNWWGVDLTKLTTSMQEEKVIIKLIEIETKLDLMSDEMATTNDSIGATRVFDNRMQIIKDRLENIKISLDKRPNEMGRF